MLDRLEAERRASSRRALIAQETERQRIAQELHDEIGQSLTAVILQLKRTAERAPVELREELLELQEAARASLDEVRQIARRLRPGVLDDLGLVSALTALATSFSEQAGLPVSRRFARSLPPLSREVELVLYRVAQEGLTNVARHARASRAELALDRSARGVTLRVTDDGRGLNGAVDGDGLRGMRERALLVGGSLRIESPPGGGVRVFLEVPTGDGIG
jgi:two-component system sensor histidine kinase UhpB